MAIPTDTLLGQQWHLGNFRLGGGFDLNVRGAWDQGFTGSGITVAVMDDGFDYNHPDLSPNYNQSLDWDYADGDNDPFGGQHGTSVAGLIAADDNGTGAVGVAFDASLIGYRVSNALNDTFLRNVHDAILDGAADAHVINMSLSTSNDINSIFGGGGYTASLFNDISNAIGVAVDSGRFGLGTILVKAAGNARSDGSDADTIPDSYDVNADPWTKDTREIVVAAVDRDGTVSSYSSYGAPVLVSAFGSNFEVLTTDRLDDAGYNTSLDTNLNENMTLNVSPSDPDFNYGFAGTSAAAPMVSGVVALMLDANPYLGWRDVQTILSYSARHVGSAVDGVTTDGIEHSPWTWNGAGNWNGGGLHFSNDYGYGLVDATAAVHLAETWSLMGAAQTSANQNWTSTELTLPWPVLIPVGLAGTDFALNNSADIDVERVALTLNFSTTYLADVAVYLTSPSGTTSELVRDIAQGSTVGTNDFDGSWTFESQAFRGESSAGSWSVRVVDNESGDDLFVREMDLRVFGHAPSIDDTYIFTNEYAAYAGTAGHSTSVVDWNGGNDWVNASAVSIWSSVIDLGGWSSQIAGRNLTLAGIENAIAGDGADRLTGNDAANKLYGMRGSDTLEGGKGEDTLDGGQGDDTYVLRDTTSRVVHGAIFDYIDYFYDTVIEAPGGGIDTIKVQWTAEKSGYTLGANIEKGEVIGTNAFNLTGNELDNSLTGNAAANKLDGKSGDDMLAGGGGNDVYILADSHSHLVHGPVFNYFEYRYDTVVEAAGGGIDTVRLQRTANLDRYVLTANVENGEITSADSFMLTGNDLANRLTGNAGSDTLDGRGGADDLRGLGGNDKYLVDNALDAVTEAAGGGSDRVLAGVSYTLSAGQEIEQLTTTNNAATTTINLTGNEFAQTLIGNAGSNVLDGKGGADTMYGLGGNDKYLVDNALDKVFESVGGGADRVLATVSYALSAGQEIEQLTTTNNAATTAINLTGNQFAQAIVGNAGNNIIAGYGGNDVLSGFGGQDIFLFNTALNAATNVDRITDYNVASDTIRLENAVFTALTTPGALAAGAFFVGAAAHDASDRIIYNSATGALFYDANGNAAGGATQFAVLSTGLALTSADFVIV